MTTTLTVAEVLQRAAALVEARGHALRTFETDDGRLCALGAIRVAIFADSRPPITWGSPECVLYVAVKDRLRTAIAPHGMASPSGTTPTRRLRSSRGCAAPPTPGTRTGR